MPKYALTGKNSPPIVSPIESNPSSLETTRRLMRFQQGTDGLGGELPMINDERHTDMKKREQLPGMAETP